MARAIGGAQAQDKRAGLLHFRSRARGLTASDVERARVDERSLVRGWLMRGTVHLVAADDYPWLLPLFAEVTARNSRRRLGQLGMSAATQERALALIERALRRDGLIRRPQIAERLESAGIAIAPEARVHLVILAVVEGLACSGPDVGGSGTLALAENWLDRGVSFAMRNKPRAQALGELARRYLGAFGPATERDFAKWSGLPLGDCREGLRRIAPDEVDASGLFALDRTKLRTPRSPVVRLLPAYDTYLMGYANRSHAVDDAGERRILPGGGVLRPTICVDGRFAGTWSSKRAGDRLAVSIEPFRPLADGELSAIEAEAADVGRFEGLEARLAGPGTIPRR